MEREAVLSKHHCWHLLLQAAVFCWAMRADTGEVGCQVEEGVPKSKFAQGAIFLKASSAPPV